MKRMLPFLGVLFAGVALAQTNVGGPDTSGPALNAGQYNLIYNFFSFAIAAMGASAIFFFLSRSNVAPKYRVALLISGVVVSIAAYHYVRIFNSFEAAYALNAAGVYAPTTVPVQRGLPLRRLAADRSAAAGRAGGGADALEGQHPQPALRCRRRTRLIILGYPGEVARPTAPARSCGASWPIPFAYISTSSSWSWPVAGTPGQGVRRAFSACAGPGDLLDGVPHRVLPPGGARRLSIRCDRRQVGYPIADVLAKPLFGLLIYAIAVAKTRDDGGVVESVNTAGAPLPVNASD